MVMPPVSRSLQQLTTKYTVFEQDQVLTHLQLNSVSDYADDQTRLTRVQLLGIGIVSGLRLSVTDGKVTVSRGVGVTSDGDIISFSADAVFDRAKIYDKTFPSYAPLYKGGDTNNDMVDVYELVREGAADALATPLSDSNQFGGRALESLTAVLLVESYVTDHDLCSGDDCDNLGQDALNTLRLLVLDDADAVDRLRESLVTIASSFAALPELSADRPQIATGLASPAELAKVYAASCANTRKELADALSTLEKRCSQFFGSELASGTADKWNTQISRIVKVGGSSDSRNQYVYDFLRDIVDLYNALRDRHLDDTSVAVPPIDAFSKHLLLGIVGAPDAANRTGFYPSPLVAGGSAELEQSRFLLRTIDRLVSSFSLPANDDRGTRITPSRFVDHALEDRAIPFYYRAVEDREIHTAWNYRLQRRNRSASIYGYDASNYAAAGSAAADPLASQISVFPFFRIEGHVGQPYDVVQADIERQITARNLPFGVMGVMLGTEPAKVVKKPPRVTDLHYFHTLLRQDMAQQLVATKNFSATMQDQVASAIDTKALVDSSVDTDNVNVRLKASQQTLKIKTSADAGIAKLTVPYAAYSAVKDTWKADVSSTLGTSGQLKRDLTSIIKTEFSTPIDTLIGSTHVNWVPWLDDIIQQRDDKANEGLLFSKFAEKHPHIEHFAGVTRGGTFVLVYDAKGIVVADFMLPYFYPKDEEVLVEPVLSDPQVRPPIVKDEGVTIVPSRKSDFTKYFDEKWTTIKPELDDRIDLQKSYLDVFTKTATVYQTPNTKITIPDSARNDLYVKSLADNILETNQQIVDLQTLAVHPDTTPADKTRIDSDITRLQTSLSQTMENTAIFVATTEPDVSAGTQGAAALTAIAKASPTVAGTPAAAASRANVEKVTSTMSNVALQKAITKNIKFK